MMTNAEYLQIGDRFFHASGAVVTVHRVQAHPSRGVAVIVDDPTIGTYPYQRRLYYPLGEKVELAR
jgi:hypothetical protein